MTLDMWRIARHANPNGTAFIDEYWSATLQPVMVFLGTIPRFYLNECRFQKGIPGAPESVAVWVWTAGIICFAGATIIFALCTYSLIEFVWDQGMPPVDGLRLLDARVITILMLIQIGYPVVFVFSIAYLHCQCGRSTKWSEEGADYPAWLSFYKDMAYATLDVTCKAGLALYVATRPLHM